MTQNLKKRKSHLLTAEDDLTKENLQSRKQCKLKQAQKQKKSDMKESEDKRIHIDLRSALRKDHVQPSLQKQTMRETAENGVPKTRRKVIATKTKKEYTIPAEGQEGRIGIFRAKTTNGQTYLEIFDEKLEPKWCLLDEVIESFKKIPINEDQP